MRLPGRLVTGVLLLLLVLAAVALLNGRMPNQLSAGTERDAREAQVAPETGADLSPLPDAKGEFVSAGADGQWHRSQSQLMLGAVDPGVLEGAPAPDCSPKSIAYYAEWAADAFEEEKNGLLYGVKTHTDATRVADMPGFNSCALVAHAILKRAGCKWARYTADAKAIYDMAYEQGWRPSDTQEAGCIVAWNSQEPGSRPRIGRDKDARKEAHQRVLYRHVGIATGSWWSMDNTSFASRPSSGITYRPFRYESPIFLCPPKEDASKTEESKAGEGK
ncbi:hypothetical protein [Methylocystis sp.]|uniref:hypothetical protein n=1 Tax=Methylocystis sp. TaxID=1911079 RepID=UPI003DA44A87